AALKCRAGVSGAAAGITRVPQLLATKLLRVRCCWEDLRRASSITLMSEQAPQGHDHDHGSDHGASGEHRHLETLATNRGRIEDLGYHGKGRYREHAP